MSKNCAVCGKIFVPGEDTVRKTAITCSKSCAAVLRNANRYKTNHIKLICEYCGKEFDVIKSYKNRKFCSHICSSNFRKGKKLSENHVRNQSLAKTAENIKKVGDYVCECGEYFNSNTSLRAHKANCNIKNELIICEICNKKFDNKKKYSIHFNYTHDKKKREKWLKALRTGLKNRKKIGQISKAEDNFFIELKKILNVERQFKVQNENHIYDFFVENYNLIIEFDGDYWHGNKFLNELDERMKKQFHIDKKNCLIAVKKGYKIIRVWDSESEQFLIEFRRVIKNGNESIKNFINRICREETNFRYNCEKKS